MCSWPLKPPPPDIRLHGLPRAQQSDTALLLGYPGALPQDPPRKRSPKQLHSRRRCSGSKLSPTLHPALDCAPANRLAPSAYIFSGASEDALTPAEEAWLADCNVPLKPAQLRKALANLSENAIGSQRHGPIGANVFVFHIPNEWHEKDLALQFAHFGPLLSARIATDKATGRRLGFGFVSYTNIAAACDAVQHLNGHSVAGKRLKVTIKRGEQQHAATFRCDLSTIAAPPVLHALVPPPPCLHENVCATETHASWIDDRKATDFEPDFDQEGRERLLALYRAGENVHPSAWYAACEEADEFAFRKNPLLDARSSQQSTNPTASDREDSSVSDGSPLRQAVPEQKRAEHILSMLLQSGPLVPEANAEQDACGMSWLENLALVMQSPDGARFISALLQLAHPAAATPASSEVQSGTSAFRFPQTTNAGSDSWEDWLFDSANNGGEKCADQ